MARTPPMPSSTSWARRWSVPPPYSRSVTLALVAAVLLDVGVEQQQRDATDLGDPDLSVQGAVTERDLDPDRAVVAVQQGERQRMGVDQRVALLLPAGAVERLLEVTLAVEQTDTDDGDTDVAGRLEVVAGQDAQPAGVLRQHLGDAELGREVADALGCGRVLRGVPLVPEVAGEVVGQVGLDHPEVLEELLVGGQLSAAARRRRRPATGWDRRPRSPTTGGRPIGRDLGCRCARPSGGFEPDRRAASEPRGAQDGR